MTAEDQVLLVTAELDGRLTRTQMLDGAYPLSVRCGPNWGVYCSTPAEALLALRGERLPGSLILWTELGGGIYTTAYER